MTFARLSDDFDSKVQFYRLSPNAVYLHVRGLQMCISVSSDGMISVETARELLQTRNIRNRDDVIAEMVACGEWSWINDSYLQIDWTHQETADQAALKAKQNAKRQADWVTRNLKCADGDHSMCVGTNRECQRKSKGVTNAVPLHSTPHHSTPQSGGGGEGKVKDTAPPSDRAGARRPSSQDGETGADRATDGARATEDDDDEIRAEKKPIPTVEELNAMVNAMTMDQLG